MSRDLVWIGFLLVFISHGQLVQTGPPDPHYCDQFRVMPNLIVEHDAEIIGRVLDASGAPFQNSRIEIRAFRSPREQIPLATTTTNRRGNFRFASIRPGKYRLIASPTRAFLQAVDLVCKDTPCKLQIMLQPSPTDQPDSQCPVR